MAEKGWICLYRQIRESWVWKDTKFDKTHAWIDLLLSANHEDKKVALGNQLILVERGSFITSELKLMKRWGWGKEKLRNFLKMLQDDGMITKKSDNRKTTITIVNYSIYQDLPDSKQTENRPPADHGQTASRPPTVHEQQYNNDNNVNNDNKKEKRSPIPKIKYAEFVSMTEEQHQKLIAKYGEESTQKMIEKLDNYIGSKGKDPYKDHYRAILNWVVDEVMKGVSKGQYKAPKNGFNSYDQRKRTPEEMKKLEDSLLGRDTDG